MQVGQGAVQCGLLLNWLQHVVDFFGDPLRRLLCLAVDEAPLLAGEPDGPPPAPEASAAHKLVIQFLLMDHLLPDPLQEEVLLPPPHPIHSRGLHQGARDATRHDTTHATRMN
jgi:hypothetical protein